MNMSAESGNILRQSGPPTTVGGKVWYPPRAYARAGCIVQPPTGKMVLNRASNKNDVWIIAGKPAYSTVDSYIFGGVGVFGPHCDTTRRPIPMSTNQRNRLITECLLKVGARKVNYGESIAESGKTIRHLLKTAITLFTAFKQVKKLQFVKAAKTLGISRKRVFRGNTPAERWLEYQYAWLPLVNDIYDTTKLAQTGLQRPQMIRAVRRLRETASVTHPSQGVTVKVNGKSIMMDQCVLHYRLNSTNLSYAHQLGLINPAEVIWAITPFSFVVDWFLPIGNFLEAITAPMGLSFVGGCLSRKVDATGSLEPISPTGSWISNTDQSDMEIPFSYSAFRREVVSSPPLPGLYMKSPFSTNHTVSALALLRQLTK